LIVPDQIADIIADIAVTPALRLGFGPLFHGVGQGDVHRSHGGILSIYGKVCQ
jgi:hypothetical protein